MAPSDPTTRHASPVTRHGPIEPGALLGVLGGGQLGAMFVRAAHRLGYGVTVWDPDPEAPALRLADRAVARPFADAAALEDFVRGVAAVTYEWENIPLRVAEAIEQRVDLRPASRVLGVIQDRLAQKSFLHGHGFPVAPFRAVAESRQLAQAAEDIGFPCLCKTATAGYDGKGQWRLDDRAAAVALQAELDRLPAGSHHWIVEGFLRFSVELSVLIARSASGHVRTYPVAGNVHEAGMLVLTRVPADLPADSARRAVELARSVVEALDAVGVCCVELFLMPDGTLFVNEVAPRPHNSGHYTLDACAVSQFEQQVRALCQLPLGETSLLSPAVMLNLIGETYTRALHGDGLEAILRTPGAVLHVYRKREVRPRRKMGHVTVLRERADDAWQAAMALRRLLEPADCVNPRL